MRYGIGAVVGALLALLLGMASFADDDPETRPPLFSVYCEFLESALAQRCVPRASGVLLMLSLGAAVGTVGAAVSLRLRPPAEDASPSAGPQGRATLNRRSGDEDREDVVVKAAMDISAAVEKRHADRARILTIRRKDASTYISDDVRDRATRLGVVNLAGSAVERALEMGLLQSWGTGPEASLALGPVAPSATAGADAGPAREPPESGETGQSPRAASARAAEAERAAPTALDEIETLIRLHERGTITDAELAAARARLLNNDDS